MEVPNYISALLQPQPSKPTGRKVWSIELEMVWLPFFTATNTVKATAIPSEALGAPLRLQYEDDGEVKFSKTGRPVVRVAKEIADQVKVVRENFTANLLTFAGNVARKEKDAYKAQVDAAYKAGVHLVARDNEALKAAYDALAVRRDRARGVHQRRQARRRAPARERLVNPTHGALPSPITGGAAWLPSGQRRHARLGW